MHNSLFESNEYSDENITDIKEIKFIDLFAGMGGLRLGFEQAFRELGHKTKCLMTLSR